MHTPPPILDTLCSFCCLAQQLLCGGQVGHLLYFQNQAAQLGGVFHLSRVAYHRQGRSREAEQQRIFKGLLQLVLKLLFLLPKLLFLLPQSCLILTD
jgi:hypothetical protein